MKTRVAILGAGDLGRTLVAQLIDHPTLVAVAFFDDTREAGTVVDALPVRGGLGDVVAAFAAGQFDRVILGIGYKHLAFRAALYDRLTAAGVPFAALIHPSAFVHPTAVVADGAVLFPRCVLDAGVHVGAGVLLNTACVVAHDTVIAPHTFLGPGVTIAGFVHVGTQCFLGVGTVIIDNVTVGDGAQTGGGAVVTREVAPRTLVVGVPAKAIRTLG